MIVGDGMKSNYLMLISFFVILMNSAYAEDATKEEYEERLDRYDLVADPEKHRVVASWCKRNYPAKHSFHQREFDKHQLAEFESKMPGTPSAPDLKKARDFAIKLDLHEEAETYHVKWGEMQYATYAKRLEPGNVKMMKQLLTWAVKEKIETIPSVTNLAESILKEEPECQILSL